MSQKATVVSVRNCKNITEVLQASDTAWEPVASPVAATQERTGEAFKPIKSGGFHAILRPDTMEALGICSSRYKPNSHVVHLARLDNMVRNGDLCPERVSVWDSGRIMAFQFSLPVLDAEIVTGDRVSPLLTLAFFNDGKHGDMSFFSDFRWACTNQMGMVCKANAGNGRAQHRGNVHATYEKLLSERIDEMKSVSSVRYQNMRRMLKQSIGGKALLSYFAVALGVPTMEESVDAVYKNEATTPHEKAILGVLDAYREDDAGAKTTVWQAYNAVTRFMTHKVGRTSAARSRNVMFSKESQEVLARAYEGAARLAA